MRLLCFFAGNGLNNCASPLMKGALNHIPLELDEVLEPQRRQFSTKRLLCLHRVGISPTSGSMLNLIWRVCLKQEHTAFL